jgi:hypothetical protein
MAAHYKTPVWQMIKEAVATLGGAARNADIVRWVIGTYPGTNQNTVQTQIGYCTVNKPSRVHCPENKKPMVAVREKDCLFTTGHGYVEGHDPTKHGFWAIVSTGEGGFAVQRFDSLEAARAAVQGGRPSESTTEALRRLAAMPPPLPATRPGGASGSVVVTSVPPPFPSPAAHGATRPPGGAPTPPPAWTPERRGTWGIVAANLAELVGNLDHYYGASLGVWQTFGGPSVYFHRKAVAAARTEFLSERHLELIYATLASWGLHRMGDTGAKLAEFDDFAASLKANGGLLTSLRNQNLASVSDTEFAGILDGPLQALFRAARVSASEDTVLVANSKALHHLVPELVPPIDRQYTIRFFYHEQRSFTRVDRNGRRKWHQVNVPASVEEQYRLFREVCLKMREILRMPAFQALARVDCPDAPFNTSLVKIVDNMIVAFVKEKGGTSDSSMDDGPGSDGVASN